MMDPQEQLYGLMSVAEEQQAAVNAAITALVEERKALDTAINGIKSTSGTLQKGTGDAAAKAVRESIGQAPKEAVTALDQARQALDDAAESVRGAGAWLTFKVAAAVAGVGLVLVLAMYGVGRFMMPSEAERQEVRDLRAEKAELEANIADLAKRGGRIKLSTCGPANRLCVQITPKQGSAPVQSDFQGAWVSEDNKSRFVIPLGY
jgi:hypothetical protein